MPMWNTVVTNKGLALQAKQVDGATIKFTRVVSGSGSVLFETLADQTDISTVVQSLSMKGLEVKGNTYVIGVLLSNTDVSNAYYLSQIGFYAEDPDEGEILFAIAQLDESRKIYSFSEAPGYGIQFKFTFENSNNATIIITPDMAAYVTRKEVEKLVEESSSDIIVPGADITE